jgi:hypothetical protein
VGPDHLACTATRLNDRRFAACATAR